MVKVKQTSPGRENFTPSPVTVPGKRVRFSPVNEVKAAHTAFAEINFNPIDPPPPLTPRGSEIREVAATRPVVGGALRRTSGLEAVGRGGSFTGCQAHSHEHYDIKEYATEDGVQTMSDERLTKNFNRLKAKNRIVFGDKRSEKFLEGVKRLISRYQREMDYRGLAIKANVIETPTDDPMVP